MAGGRKIGSKNSYKSTRNQTTAEKKTQNDKAQASRKRAREAREEKERRKNRSRLFSGLGVEDRNNDVAEGNNNQASNPNLTAGGEANATANGHHEANESTCVLCDTSIEITHQTISQNNNNLFQATNFVANLDYNEEQANTDGWDDNLCDDGDGIQQSFNEAITKRIQLEISRHTKDRTEVILLAACLALAEVALNFATSIHRIT